MISRARRGLLQAILFGVGLGSCAPFFAGGPTSLPIRSVRLISGLEQIWSLTNVYSELDEFSPRMIAESGGLVILGNIGDKLSENIISLRESDGSVKWKIPSRTPDEQGYPSVLLAAQDGIYVGYGGVPSVKKYGILDGDLLWAEPLAGRGLTYMYVQDSELQILTDPFIFTVLDRTDGRIIRSLKVPDDVLVMTPEQTFVPVGMGQLRATRTGSGDLLWMVGLDRELRLAPIFSDTTIYLRSGNLVGSVYAIQRFSGAVLWKTNDVVIGNIALGGASGPIYALTQDGKLLKIDGATGQSSTLAEFSNAPLTMSGYQSTGGYELAYDNTSGSLFVLLGDTRQLFALRLK